MNIQHNIVQSILNQDSDKPSVWAHFPMANPNIVFSMDLEKDVDFFNPVARKWLEDHEFTDSNALLTLLPKTIIRKIVSNLKSAEDKLVGESLFNSCFFQYRISKFPEHSLFFVELIDISEQKRIERLREDTERIVKHDLRSPLTAIIGYAQLLLSSDIDNESKKRAAQIYSAGNELSDMINSSLDIFKMEEGTYPLQQNEFNLLEVIENIRKNVSSMYKNKINCTVEGVNTITQYPIIADKKHIKTVLNNIIKNALEASPDVENININIFHDTHEHIIKVSNKGEIPEPFLDIFFDKYTTMGKNHGTGLGTYSARLIVETHNGKLDVSSHERKVTLTIRLPVNQ